MLDYWVTYWSMEDGLHSTGVEDFDTIREARAAGEAYLRIHKNDSCVKFIRKEPVFSYSIGKRFFNANGDRIKTRIIYDSDWEFNEEVKS